VRLHSEEVTAELRIVLSRNLFKAYRAGGDIAEVAVGANRREHGTGDVSAVQTLFADRVMSLRQINTVGMSIFLQNSSDFFGVSSRELKMSAFLFVAVNSMKRIVRVNLYWRMRPEILPNGSSHTQVTSTIFSREDGDSEPRRSAQPDTAAFCSIDAVKKPFEFFTAI